MEIYNARQLAAIATLLEQLIAKVEEVRIELAKQRWIKKVDTDGEVR